MLFESLIFLLERNDPLLSHDQDQKEQGHEVPSLNSRLPTRDQLRKLTPFHLQLQLKGSCGSVAALFTEWPLPTIPARAEQHGDAQLRRPGNLIAD